MQKQAVQATTIAKGKELVMSNPLIGELTVVQLRNQITKIQEIMKAVMKQDVHYGTVPGVPKPFLWKAGAEKLNMVFRLIPEYITQETSLTDGHMICRTKCILYHVSGTKVGEGEAMCSTLEKKYRYRNECIDTGLEVWSAWWEQKMYDVVPKNMRNNNLIPKTELQMKKEGLDWGTMKVGKKWHFAYVKKVPNPDVAELYNTVIKMSDKRALVAATISALAVSDIFSQDPEVLNPDFEEPEKEEEKEEEKKKSVPKVSTRMSAKS
jgi:hypothetical protein